ncbi:winged helix-turn-helix domain-containing protein [Deinococcus koreensis]|uniref:winged helix-turn-helix domain-containing protein n=1 Tax=Deinococcus koreensis TaxID=2054903 RepID=UPI0013FD7865|nr:winged helix-turn-helix domain-containing protein [Deinococcus koreensis]
MTSSQVEVRRIQDANLARLLQQERSFLAQFIDPRSPSEVAARVDMAPNLAHHHARKLADAGLLFEQRREGGRVYYQLCAQEFRVPSRLRPPGDLQGNGSADMRELGEGFMRAYERSWAAMHEGEEDVFGFGSAARPATTPCEPDALGLEAHPTHLDALSLRLSPERYQRLARALSALLAEAAAEGHSPQGHPCTLAVLTFQLPGEGATPGSSLSHTINSFLGAPADERSPR